MILPLLLLLSQTNADQVLDRFSEYSKNHTNLTVEMKAGLDSLDEKGSGSFTIERDPARMALRFEISNQDYAVRIDKEGVFELERNAMIYDENPFTGDFDMAPSRISWVPTYFTPWPFIIGDIKRLHGGAEFKLEGTEQVGDKQADLVMAEYSFNGINMSVWAAIDEEGKLLRYRTKSVGDAGSIDVEMFFTNYSSSKPDSFDIYLPDGYMPHAVPKTTHKLVVGSSFPMGGWTNAKTGERQELLSILNSKSALIVISGANPLPNLKTTAIIDMVQSQGIHTVQISTAQEASQIEKGLKGHVLYDPTGKELAKIAPPGTPLFYLVDKTGTIVKFWFGIDAERLQDLEEEIVEAFHQIPADKRGTDSGTE